jgi:Cupin superfamily protein
MSIVKKNGDFGVWTLIGEKSSELMSPKLLERPLVFHGNLQRLASFTNLPVLRSPSAVIGAWDGTNKTVRAWSPIGSPSYEIYPNREQLQTLYDAGCTLVFEDVERFVPELKPLCRALEKDLNVAPGRVNVEVFCARTKSHSRAHFDPSFTFNCQIQGSKKWHLANHEAIRFPPTGMFLGRPPKPDFANLLTKTLPTEIDGGEIFIAEPGSVVFLPPGVLHETFSDAETFAIAFAIEQVDTISGIITDSVKTRLQKAPFLRAARLGAQFQDMKMELEIAAKELRCIADELEFQEWPNPKVMFQIKSGLSIESLGGNQVILKSVNVARTLSLDEVAATILVWASGQKVFSFQDITNALVKLDPELIDEYIHLLLHRGLLNYVE